MRKAGVNTALTALAALGLGLTACGGGSSTSSTSSTTATTAGGSTSGGSTSGGSSGGGSGGGGSGGTATAIASFSAPSTVNCTSATTITLSWTTRNATSVTISIDGPGIYNTYPANGSASVPFACDGKSHTYLLTAKGPHGTATSTRVVSKGGTTTSTTKK